LSDGSASIPDVSVIVPMAERSDDPETLWREYGGELKRLGRTFEFLFVVDGPMRHLLPALARLRAREGGAVRVFAFGRTFGEAAALAVGIARARARRVLTLAAYLQVAPDGIGLALERLDAKDADVVIGRRHPRTDPFLNRAQSAVFHHLMKWMTGAQFHDVSCGLRAMAKETAQDLALYGDLHRFIPILALNRGFVVREVLVAQRAEDRKLRYAGVGIYLRRMLDLLSVFFLVKFTRKPLRFFGPIGVVAMGVGGAITLYLGVYRILGAGGIADRPLLLLGLLLLVVGVQSISLGLLGEIIIYTHARRMTEYRIAEILE